MSKRKPRPRREWTSDALLALLRTKHSNDVFVPECKNGETYNTKQLRKLDAWVMRRSWAHFSTIGYEIKVSRSDFERDEKWVEYLDYCHEFWFVCPPGLIRAEELPKGVGLLWGSVSGEKLFTRTHAEKRVPNHEKAAELMQYVLMFRAAIDAQPAVTRTRIESYTHLMEAAERRKAFAHFVSVNIRERFARQEAELEEMRRMIKTAESFREQLRASGVEWTGSQYDWNVHRRIRELCNVVPDGFTRQLRDLARAAEHLADDVAGLDAKREAAE